MKRKVDIKSILFMLLGPAITAFGTCGFSIPNRLVGGGVAGIGTILFHSFAIPPSITTGAINVLLLLISFRFLGLRFLLKTLLGAGLFSIYLQLFSGLPALTNDLVLAVLFAAALDGIGIGITLAAGGTTGGTDIVGRLVQHWFPSFPIGRLLLAVNGAIVLASVFAFTSIELFLYGILALILTNTLIDQVIKRLNASRFIFLITEKGEEVAAVLLQKVDRGVTVLHGTGAYTGHDKSVLLCALKESETEQLQKAAREIDPQAFVVVTSSRRVLGKGFRYYY